MTNIAPFSKTIPLKFMKVFGNLSSQELTPRLFVYLIVVTVFCSFYPCLKNTFVWDDRLYLLENLHYRGFNFTNIFWMFTNFVDANYHPLYWISLALDYTLWKMNPAGYHLANLLFHILNTLLVFILIPQIIHTLKTPDTVKTIYQTTVAAFIGSLFFGLHPLRVEPVSWLCARGDLMCCFFYLLTVICYLKMAEKKDGHHKKRWFLLSLVFFVFSLLSRAWGITMPAILILLDMYPLYRFKWAKPFIRQNITILFEKIPFAFLSIIFGILAFLAKKPSMAAMSEHDIINRLMQTSYGLIFYLFKTIVPVRLSPLYLLDHKNYNPFEFKYILCLFLLIAIIAAVVVLRKRFKWLIASFSSYIIIVSPLLGFVQSGPQIAADRYTYISCLPFAILAGAGVLKLFDSRMYRIPAMVLIGSVIFFMAGLSFTQCHIWQNNISLWSHAIKLNPHNEYAFYNRGAAYSKIGDERRAIDDYNMAIRYNPYNIKAYNNRGLIRTNQNDFENALRDFNFALQLNPNIAEAHCNIGIIYYKKKEYDKAINVLTKAVGMAPSDWKFQSMAQDWLKKSEEQLLNSKKGSP